MNLPSTVDLETAAHRFYGAYVGAISSLARASPAEAAVAIEVLRGEIIGLLTLLQPRAASPKQQRELDQETILYALAKLLPAGTEVKITPRSGEHDH